LYLVIVEGNKEMLLDAKSQVVYSADHLELLKNHEAGTLNLSAHEIKLYTFEGDLFAETQGIIGFDKNNRLAIIIEKDTVDCFQYMKLMTSGRMGAYHPLEKKLIAKGTTNANIKFETDPLDFGAGGIGVPNVLRINKITFTSEAGDIPYSRISLIDLDNHFLPFDREENRQRQSTYKLNHPHLYCVLKLEKGDYEICSVEKANCVQTFHKFESAEEQNRFEQTTLLAMSFVAGKKISRIGTYEIDKLHNTTLYRKRNDFGNVLFAPIRFNNAKPGLGMIHSLQDFLVKNSDPNLENILEIFLLPGNVIEPNIRSLVVCVLLEGLITSLYSNRKNVIFDKSREKLVSLLESNSIEGIDEATAKRFSRIVRSVTELSLPEKLDQLSQQLKIYIEESEKVFKKIRNRLAHGEFTSPYGTSFEEDQKELDELGYISNLFNKILLRAAGYLGDYCDYSVLGWKDSNFASQIAEHFPSTPEES
jgi:hypothetical protein